MLNQESYLHAQISSRKSNSISEFVTRESASAYINPKLAKAKEEIQDYTKEM